MTVKYCETCDAEVRDMCCCEKLVAAEKLKPASESGKPEEEA